MKNNYQSSKQEVKYCLDFYEEGKLKYFPKSKKTFMLVCSTKRIEPKNA